MFDYQRFTILRLTGVVVLSIEWLWVDIEWKVAFCNLGHSLSHRGENPLDRCAESHNFAAVNGTQRHPTTGKAKIRSDGEKAVIP